MKAKKTRLLCLLMTITLVFALFAGCGAPSEPNDSTEAPEKSAAPSGSAAEPTEQVNAEAPTEPGQDDYLPLTTDDVTLSFWCAANVDTSNNLEALINGNNYADRAAEELTGVHIDWQMIYSGNTSEMFNVMISSGDWPDIIDGFATSYVTGGSGGISDGVIVDLADYMDCMPYYGEYLKDPIVAKDAGSDDGSIYSFYIMTEAREAPLMGMFIREDWLDGLNMAMPTTYDELHDTLEAFKVEYEPKYPLYMNQTGILYNNNLIGGYGIVGFTDGNTYPFYQVDGVVKYGPIEAAYKEYLTMMNQWYKEGIINSDFTTISPVPFTNTTYEDICASDTGVWVYAFRQDDGWKFNNIDPNFQCTALADVTKTPGEDIDVALTYTSVVDHAGVSVAATSNNLELAIRWCDFWYSDTGRLLAVYGIEGESYVIDENGEPKHTDLILHPEEGTTMQYWQYMYCMPQISTQFYTQRAVAIEQNDMEVWGSNRTGKNDISEFTTFTAEESTQFSDIMADIATYTKEMTLQFIIGQKPLDEFDSFVQGIKDMGIDEAIKLKQTSYDRYLER